MVTVNHAEGTLLSDHAKPTAEALKQRPLKADPQDFIILFKGETYDIQNFLQLHPGGLEILEQYRGKDVTQVMRDPSIHQHSEAAFEYLKAMKCSKPSERLRSCQDAALKNPSKVVTLNLNKPLLWQLWSNELDLSKEDYLKMIHESPILSRRTYRLFGSSFLEIFSKTPWWVVPVVWIPIIVLLLCYAVSNKALASSTLHSSSPFLVYSGLLLGFFSWTILEYLFHRMLFHLDVLMPRHPYMYTLHFLVHGVHHFLPLDPLRLVMPPILFACLSMPVVLPILSLQFISLSLRLSIIAGIFCGYVCYDMTHYYLHHAQVRTPYFRSLKEYHMDHHFKNPNTGFGVTSKLWDYIFHT